MTSPDVLALIAALTGAHWLLREPDRPPVDDDTWRYDGWEYYFLDRPDLDEAPPTNHPFTHPKWSE